MLIRKFDAPICAWWLFSLQILAAKCFNFQKAKESGYFLPLRSNEELRLMYEPRQSTQGYLVDPQSYAFQSVFDAFDLSIVTPYSEEFGISILVIHYDPGLNDCSLKIRTKDGVHLTVNRPRLDPEQENLHEDHILTTWDHKTSNNSLDVVLQNWKSTCQLYLIITLHRLQNPILGENCINYRDVEEFTCGPTAESKILCITYEGNVGNHVPNCAQKSLPNSDEVMNITYWILTICLNVLVTLIIFMVFVFFVRFIFMKEWLSRSAPRRQQRVSTPSDMNYERPVDAPPSYFNIVKEASLNLPTNPPPYSEVVRHM